MEYPTRFGKNERFWHPISARIGTGNGLVLCNEASPWSWQWFALFPPSHCRYPAAVLHYVPARRDGQTTSPPPITPSVPHSKPSLDRRPSKLQGAQRGLVSPPLCHAVAVFHDSVVRWGLWLFCSYPLRALACAVARVIPCAVRWGLWPLYGHPPRGFGLCRYTCHPRRIRPSLLCCVNPLC